MKKKNIFIVLTSFCFLSISFFIYFVFFTTNIPRSGQRINIGSEMSYELFLRNLNKNKIVTNPYSLKIVASLFKKRNRSLKCGSYKLDRDFSNIDFLNKITKGEQDPVQITIGYHETKEELVKYLCKHLLFSENDITKFLNNENFLDKYNVNPNTVLTLFLPNTYQMYWNITLENFFDRIYREFNVFWTKERCKKANEINLTPNEVIILASIVDKEIVRQEEASAIAGVFINRLRKKMRLQSDPTTFYAKKYDPQENDVHSVMRGIKSKYNTYRYNGLPIGPICIPKLRTIDAVLNYEKHDFLFFVTAPDRSHHIFSQTYQGHLKNVNLTFRKGKK